MCVPTQQNRKAYDESCSERSATVSPQCSRYWYLLTYLLTHSMVQHIIWKARSHSACQKISCFLYETWRFITVFIKACTLDGYKPKFTSLDNVVLYIPVLNFIQVTSVHLWTIFVGAYTTSPLCVHLTNTAVNSEYFHSVHSRKLKLRFYLDKTINLNFQWLQSFGAGD